MTTNSPPPTMKESSDEYCHVLATVGRYRIARTYDCSQWIVQRRRSGDRGGKSKWDALGYCRGYTTLSRLCRIYIGSVPPEISMLQEASDKESGHV